MYDKITLPSLITLLSEKTGKSKRLCEDFLREFFGTLVNTLGEGENVKIKGIGTFKVVEVEPRKSVNVNTGEEMEIPGHRKITFTPAKEMADDVNSPFAMFESVEIGDEAEEEPEAAEEIEAEQPTIPVQPTAIEPVGVEEPEEIKAEEEEIIEEVPAGEEIIEEPEEETVSEEISPEEEVEESVEDPSEESNEEPAEGPIEEPSEEPVEEFTEESNDESFPEYEYYDEEPKKKYHFLWGFLCGLFCTAILVAICYFFLADKFNAIMGSVQDKEPAATPTVVNTQTAPVDTENVLPDSVSSMEEQEDVAPTKPSDEIVYDTIYTSKNKTRYLTTMAKAHYGNYNLWPVIYEENKAILGHPDRIRPGTRVVIPPLSKYGVDPNNPDDIAKAKKKGVEIYARFK